MKSFLSALVGALTVSVVFAALALGGVFDPDDDDRAATSSTAPASPSAPAARTPAPADVAAVYERARPGVVDIRVRRGPGGATGSGFVLDDRGTIVTNEHVIDDARTARIRFAGQDRPVSARVLGTDPSSDLAVLRVDPDAVQGRLRPLALTPSDDLRVGQAAIAVGSPFGLDGTLTTGVVSGLERDIQARNGFTIAGAIATDAAINPGNSGGPLLDDRGRVIGVNAQRAGGAGSSLGFAIGADTVRDVAPRLARGEEIERAYLGVATSEREQGDGARVGSVTARGPAARGGLRAGDIITRVGDTRVTEPDDVAAAIAARQPGDSVQITFTRDGDERVESIRLGERPEEISTR